MSIPDSDPAFLQRMLRASGFYKGSIDGEIGTSTKQALADFDAKSAEIATAYGAFDKRTEGNIRSLLPNAQIAARKLMKDLAKAGLSSGMSLKIISGTRTYAEQAMLYQKFLKGGPQAASPGHSNHNFGIAWDVGIFTNGGKIYIDDLAEAKKMTHAAVDKEYKKVGAYSRGCGLFWGGDWSKPDLPHHQVLDNNLLAEIRKKFEDGGVIV